MQQQPCHQQPLHLPLLLLLLWGSLCCVTEASLPWCGDRLDGLVPPLPTVAIPRVALGWLNTTGFDAAGCSLSFEQFAAAHSDWVTCYHAPLINVHTCPQHCSRANASVDGASPYSGASSICLAAIRAGLINDSSGGAVLVDRFYPPSWNTTDSSSSSSTMWTVRSRRPQARQRQSAPFSPRAGHLHAWLYEEVQLRANWSLPQSALNRRTNIATMATLNYSLHFVIGGHNDTHYMNDVSAAARPLVEQQQGQQSHRSHNTSSLCRALPSVAAVCRCGCSIH